MKKITFFCLGLAIAACLGLTANLHADDKAATTSTEAILQHPGFREGLVWIGKEPSEKENARLLQIIGDLNKPYWRSEVEKFLEDFPDSPWAASLHYAYGSFCHQSGRTSRALEHWEAGWNLVKSDTSANGKRLGGEILAHWTEQLSSLGRRDKLRELIAVGDQWPFANRLDRERFQSAKHNYLLMGRHPEMSYRCGTLALKAVGQAMQPTNQALQSLVEIGSPVDGFSMSGLAELAKQDGLDLVAVRRTEGQDLIVPSVIHWRQNHYAAILQQDGESFLINDPTFGRPHWLQRDAINEEASGFFLIPSSKQTAHWQTLGAVELASIHGKGLYNSVDDALDKGCTTVAGNAPECNCAGMPVWWVSEPYNNLWIADEPISYLTSTGERFTFRINYKQRGLGPNQPYMPLGVATNANFNPWLHSWFSYLVLESPTVNNLFPTLTNSYITLGLPGGGEVDFSPGQTYDPQTRIQLQQTDPNTSLGSQWTYSSSGYTPPTSPDNGNNGVRVIHPDGSQDIYGFGLSWFIPGSSYPAKVTYMLSRHIDTAGRTTTYIYGGTYTMLTYVVDYDGRTNTLSYAPALGIGGDVLTKVTNPYGLTAQFEYDGNQNLTNITDAEGLPSSIAYDTNYFPTSLITPYGTNTFALYENATLSSTNGGDGNFGTESSVDRAEVITDAIGGTHLYLYQFDCAAFMATNYSSGDVPTNTPLGTLDAGTGSTNSLSGVNFRNSFAWNARQYAALSTTNFLSLSSNDFLRGRMKHWLQDTNNLYLSEYLSVERDPSPDGTTEGLKTFYDYQGKLNNYQAGTNPVPSVTAWCLPGGETHYEYLTYDSFGNITNQITTYTTTAGALGTRTKQFFYTNNIYTNVFYAPYADSNGVYDIYLPFSTNTFTVPSLRTRVVEANGSNLWSYGGFDPVVLCSNYFPSVGAGESNLVVLSALRVLPDYMTNGLNQVTTRTFTNFNLVSSVQWPSGLIKTNIYGTNGFLAQSVYQQIQRTNGFTYSTNGLLSTFTNELGLVVNLSWDNLLRLTGIAFPDTTTTSNVYYRLDRSAHMDRLGNWTYFGYDGLRHLTAVTNANSNVTSYGWCDCGALTSITDALTNTTTLNYDYEDRLTGSLFPDGSSMSYQYDLAGRRTNVFDGSGASVNLAYNNQSLTTNVTNSYGSIANAIFDILDRPASITDENNITATNTFDMLDRLLSRIWTVDGIGEGFLYATNGLIAYTNRDSQITGFARDAAERLTVVTNANVPPSVTQFAYDPANNLTNLVDGLNHSNGWSYNPLSWVTNKVDASNHQAFVYSYNANGWLTNRWMPASGNTQYKFDAVGNLTNIVYSNTATTSISFSCDADNHLTNMIDAIGTTTWTYNSNGLVASETGPWTSNTVIYNYNQGHRTSLTLSQPTGGAWTQSYSYDSAWRLTNLSSPAGSFGYSYPAAASRLILGVSLPNAAYITNQYDSLARLTNTSLINYWGHVLDGYGYGYDSLGLRTNISRYLGITTNNITAGYDNIAQLTSWSVQETNGKPRLNEQQSYGYDAADNLHLRTNGALVQTFSVDALNQLSSVARTGNLTLSGATPAPATNVTVNGNAAQTYADFTFASTNNGLTNGVNTFTVIATNLYGVSSTNVLTVNLPSTVTFLNDSNNNLTADGTRNFVFDAENQLTNVYVTNLWQIQFVYDGLRRRRIEKDFAWQGSAWVQTNETHFIYDGWLPIQERASNNAVQVTYTRGLDLKGSLQRAGGIGGLLARTDSNGSVFYHADGNGNITALMDANQNIVARYEYDPFGRLIGKWGSMADANHYRFSSKEYDTVTGLYYFGRRFYDPTLQRWLNRDPIANTSGLKLQGGRGTRTLPVEAVFGPNLYTFVYNNPETYVDPNGLWGIAFGNNSGSSYFNIGWGNPSLYFSPDSGNGVGQSAAATADGLNPFGNPFASHGAYDPNDPLNKFSHGAGKVAQVCLTSAAGLGALKAANAAFMPATLYHFTSVEGAAAITASGGIDASAGLYGYGTYLTGFNSATMAAIQGASATEVAIPIATEGLEVSATYFPGTYIVRGAGVLLP